MKMIMAMIRIDKMNETKKALSEAGAPSYTATGRVFGRGQGAIDKQLLKGVDEGRPEAVSLLGSEPRLRPQRMITVVVQDQNAPKVVEALIKANQTGEPGDGKIFVLPASEAITVRNGGDGDGALD